MFTIHCTSDASFSAYASETVSRETGAGQTITWDSGGGSTDYLVSRYTESTAGSSVNSQTDVSTTKAAAWGDTSSAQNLTRVADYTAGTTHNAAISSWTDSSQSSETYSDTAGSISTSESSSASLTADPDTASVDVWAETVSTSFQRTVRETVTTTVSRLSADTAGTLETTASDTTTRTVTATQQSVSSSSFFPHTFNKLLLVGTATVAEPLPYAASGIVTFGTQTNTTTAARGNEVLIVATSFPTAPDFLTDLGQTTSAINPTFSVTQADIRTLATESYTESTEWTDEFGLYTEHGTRVSTLVRVPVGTLTIQETVTTSDAVLTFHVVTAPTTSASTTYTTTTYEPFTTTGTTEDFSTWTTTTSWTEYGTTTETTSDSYTDTYETSAPSTTDTSYTVYHTEQSTVETWTITLESGETTLTTWGSAPTSILSTDETTVAVDSFTLGWTENTYESYIETDSTFTVTFWTSEGDPITESATGTYESGGSTFTYTWTWETSSLIWGSWTDEVFFWGPDTVILTNWDLVTNYPTQTTLQTLSAWTTTAATWTSDTFTTSFTETTTYGLTDTTIIYAESTVTVSLTTTVAQTETTTITWEDTTTITDTAQTVTSTAETTDGTIYTTTSTLWTYATATTITATGVSSIPATVTLLRTESFAPWDSNSTFTTTAPSYSLDTSTAARITTRTVSTVDHTWTGFPGSAAGMLYTVATTVPSNATVPATLVLSAPYPDAASTVTATTTVSTTDTASTTKDAEIFIGQAISTHTLNEFYVSSSVLYVMPSASTSMESTQHLTDHGDGPWATITGTHSESGSTSVAVSAQFEVSRVAGFRWLAWGGSNTELCPAMGNGLRAATDENYTAPLYTSASWSVPPIVVPIWSKDETTTTTGTATSDTATTTTAGTVASRTTSTVTWEAWSAMQETSATAGISYTGTSSHSTSRTWTDQAVTLTTTGTGQTTAITTTDPFTMRETVSSVYSGASLFLTRLLPMVFTAPGGGLYSVDGRYGGLFETTSGTYSASVAVLSSVTDSTHSTFDARTLDMPSWDEKGPLVMGGFAAVDTVQPVHSWTAGRTRTDIPTTGGFATSATVMVGVRQTVYPRTETNSTAGTVQSWTVTSELSTWVSTVPLSQLVAIEPCTVGQAEDRGWTRDTTEITKPLEGALSTFRFGLVFDTDTGQS